MADLHIEQVFYDGGSIEQVFWVVKT